jgi:hypothetical protein
MSLFDQNFDVASFLPKRTVGPFSATIVLEEVGTDELEITQHPVQQGASITDHAYLKPSTINLKLMWNDDDAPLSETYQNLLLLQSSRVPLDVVTGKRAYTNMLIKSLGQTTDVQTENVLSINMQMQEIIITAVEVTTVPPRANQKNAGKTGATENAGKKSAQETPKKRSALAALAGKGG